MKRIFAIGGGEIKSRETLDIDKKIVEAVHKDQPNVLFIPTASSDAEGYVETIERVYGEVLGCQVDSLLLVDTEISDQEIKGKIDKADIVYVGGGNTRKMMGIWKEKKVDVYLKEAYEQGTVMSGLSAGSICWFAEGHSDSDTYEAGEVKPYTVVEGLGIIPMFHCPHHNEDNREEDFDGKILERKGVGLALQNNAAIEFEEDRFRILISDYMAKAYIVYEQDGQVKREELPVSDAFHPLRYLTEYKERLSHN